MCIWEHYPVEMPNCVKILQLPLSGEYNFGYDVEERIISVQVDHEM